MTQEETENPNSLFLVKELNLYKNIPKRKPRGFNGKFYEIYNEVIKSALTHFLEEERSWPNSLYKASKAQISKPDKDITKKENYKYPSSVQTQKYLTKY